MLELHHNGMSTCSQKVRLALAEKGVAFESREVNLMAGEQRQPAFLALNPRGVVPVLVHDGRAIVESTLIAEYVDEAFDGPDLMPAHPADRAQSRDWAKQVDERLSAAVGILLSATAQRAFQLMRAEAEVLAEIDQTRSPTQRALRRSLFAQGVEAPEVDQALETLQAFLDEAETALSHRPWLGGDTPTLGDFAVFPYLLRVENMALQVLWADGARPSVERWIAAMKARPSYATAVEAWLFPPALALMAANGAQILPKLAVPRAASAAVPA